MSLSYQSYLVLPLLLFSTFVNLHLLTSNRESVNLTTLDNEHFKTNNDVNQNEKNSISLKNALSEQLSDIFEIVKRIASKLRNDESHDLFAKLTGIILNAIKHVENKLSETGGIMAQELIETVLSHMDDIKTVFTGLGQNLEDELYLSVQNLNESLISHTETIDLWAAKLKNDLRTINNTIIYKKVCQVVDEFIDDSTAQLRNCCNIRINPVISLCRSARALLAESLKALADVLDRMQICLEDKNSYLEYMMPCVKLAYDEVSTLMTQAVQFRDKVETMLPIKIMYSKCCISVALVKMEERKKRLTTEFLSHDGTS